MIKQAIILAGGRGKRLMPLTKYLPKPMVKINGKPFLGMLIKQINSFNIENIIILAGYRGNIIKNYFRDNQNIKVIINPAKFLTGSRLLKNYDLLDQKFLLLYSDNFINFSFGKYLKKINSNKKIHMLLQNHKLAHEVGNIKISKKKINYFSRRNNYSMFVEMGYMILNKKLLHKYNHDKNISLSTILEKEVSFESTSYYITNAKYNSITNPANLQKTADYLSKITLK